MKLLFLSCLLLFSTVECDEIQEIRDDFHKINSEESLSYFLSNHKASVCPEAIPYVAAATMRQADYCLWPGSKLSYFSEGKKKLENYIQENKSCIEGRYVRALVQSQLPSFLGYSSDFSSDCDYVKTHISSSNLPLEYQQKMLNEIELILKEN